MDKRYCVYIMTNIINTVLYTGVTNDLKRRVWEHKQSAVDGFSKRYNTIKLVYYECTEDVLSAIAREKKIKKLYRKEKFEMINVFNPKWRDLYHDL
jgi:putative endonuclease